MEKSKITSAGETDNKTDVQSKETGETNEEKGDLISSKESEAIVPVEEGSELKNGDKDKGSLQAKVIEKKEPESKAKENDDRLAKEDQPAETKEPETKPKEQSEQKAKEEA